MTRTKLGAALMMLSGFMYKLSCILEDAGERYEEIAPPYIEKAKHYSGMAWEWFSVNAWAVLVFLGCILAASIRGAYLAGMAIKEKAPVALRACMEGARAALGIAKALARTMQRGARAARKALAQMTQGGKRAMRKGCATAARVAQRMRENAPAAPLETIARTAGAAWAFRAAITAEGREQAC